MRTVSIVLFAIALLPLLVPACSGGPPDGSGGAPGGSTAAPGGSTAAPGGSGGSGGSGGAPGGSGGAPGGSGGAPGGSGGAPGDCPIMPDWTPPEGMAIGGTCCYRLIPCLSSAQSEAYEAACNPASVAPLRNALLCTGIPASNDCVAEGAEECGLSVACCVAPF